jgi:transposase
MYPNAGASGRALVAGIDVATGSGRIWRAFEQRRAVVTLEQSGLIELYEGSHPGRPAKWNELQRQALRKQAEEQRGTAGVLLRRFRQNQQQPAVSVDTIKRYLKKMDMSYKRVKRHSPHLRKHTKRAKLSKLRSPIRGVL